MAGNISLMRKRMYGKSSNIKCAMDRFALQMFGGKYTIEEFRKFSVSNEPAAECVINMPDRPHNFVSVGFVETVFEKSEYKPQSTEKLSTKMKNINNSSAPTESLKLKRNKPLKRDASNLENLMGITRRR